MSKFELSRLETKQNKGKEHAGACVVASKAERGMQTLGTKAYGGPPGGRG